MGGALKRVKEKLAGKTAEGYHFTYLAVFAKKASKSLVDIYFELVETPRLFQWNYLNHVIAESSCYDIDGVLCHDPLPAQNDDGEKYVDFLLHAKPLYIPSYKIYAIVTSRLEKYRPQTEQWLREHHVQYEHLYMLTGCTAEERRKRAVHSAFKAQIYNKLTNCKLFVESNPRQAQEIFDLTGKPVVCVETDDFYGVLED